MPKAKRLIRPMTIFMMLSLTACGERSDWPSLSCWGDMPPAVAEVPAEGTLNVSASPTVERPEPMTSGAVDLAYWGERLTQQWQVFEKAVLLIDKAADQDMAMSYWLGAQLELTSVADILAEFDRALVATPDEEARVVRAGWDAAFKTAAERMKKLKP